MKDFLLGLMVGHSLTMLWLHWMRHRASRRANQSMKQFIGVLIQDGKITAMGEPPTQAKEMN